MDTQNKFHVIYALEDPRDSRVRFIGVEACARTVDSMDIDIDVEVHLKKLLAATRSSAYALPSIPKNAWIIGLHTLGLEPKIIQIERVVPPKDPNAEKRFWIGVHIDHSHPLLNVRDRAEDQAREFSEDDIVALAKGKIL